MKEDFKQMPFWWTMFFWIAVGCVVIILVYTPSEAKLKGYHIDHYNWWYTYYTKCLDKRIGLYDTIEVMNIGPRIMFICFAITFLGIFLFPFIFVIIKNLKNKEEQNV